MNLFCGNHVNNMFCGGREFEIENIKKYFDSSIRKLISKDKMHCKRCNYEFTIEWDMNSRFDWNREHTSHSK